MFASEDISMHGFFFRALIRQELLLEFPASSRVTQSSLLDLTPFYHLGTR